MPFRGCSNCRNRGCGECNSSMFVSYLVATLALFANVQQQGVTLLANINASAAADEAFTVAANQFVALAVDGRRQKRLHGKIYLTRKDLGVTAPS